ncbi:TPA: hypothetical protein R1Q24_005299, partial [Escherichia coli]|nr:hypothetical protein [Escherichia coli]
PVVLALLYVFGHGLVVALLPGPAGLGSFVFLTGAPLLAAAACLWRARADRAALGWRAIALALLLWAGGMGINMLDALSAGRPDITPGASLLLYVLYGVPLVFILARSRRERWAISVIDGIMAALLGVLFFVHTQSFADHVGIDDQALANMQRMFDIQNLCIAVFAIVRWVSCDVPERRSVFRALALYALAYLLVAYYINHFT